MEENLIAPCGMNCALCISYQTEKTDLNQKGFRKKTCPGCIPRGKHCVFLKSHCTLIGNGLIRFCYECDEFPCVRIKSLDTRYRTKYHMSMIENQIYIRDNGIKSFLEKEADKWRCPDCGGNICCHNGLCLSCDLEKYKSNKTYRWGE